MLRKCLCFCALVALACDGASLTEILVVVDSDIAVPGELDTVTVEVSGAEDMIARGALTGADGRALPRTVGVVYRGGSLGPLRVTVTGTVGDIEVGRALAITSFIEGRTLVLPMFLSARCRGVACGDDETCQAGVCGSAEVDPSTLDEWNGSIDRIDAGSCTVAEERCNGGDDDCDGMVDEDFDLQTDPMNCGGCSRSCGRANAMTECSGGTCSITGCEAGFDDCDADPMNGCESDTATDPLNCSECGVSCEVANATAGCSDGMCSVLSCDSGFGDCDDDATNGCETSLRTLTDCGTCGMACTVPVGTPSCTSGTCMVDSCGAGTADCDGDATNGCETMTDTLTDCGACDTACDVPNGTESCATGTCQIDTCDAGFGDCDADASNGCEQMLNTLVHCAGCDTACTIANGTGTCTTGTCVAMCNPSFGNCDGDTGNGCEADLRTDEMNCMTCGNVCPPADPECRNSVCR